MSFGALPFATAAFAAAGLVLGAAATSDATSSTDGRAAAIIPSPLSAQGSGSLQGDALSFFLASTSISGTSDASPHPAAIWPSAATADASGSLAGVSQPIATSILSATGAGALSGDAARSDVPGYVFARVEADYQTLVRAKLTDEIVVVREGPTTIYRVTNDETSADARCILRAA